MDSSATVVSGRAVLLARDDIDTDAIYPARFLNTIERDGLGQYLFADWRDANAPELAPFQQQTKLCADVLVGGRNFGCGSSREHAVWALADCGIRAIVALSFGDIFRSNCTCNGIVTAQLTTGEHRTIVDALRHAADVELTIDLLKQRITLADRASVPFQIDADIIRQLCSREDDIEITLRHAAELLVYERRVASKMAWLCEWRSG
ncbi:3-isopropylmalate dehydratase small subunit [Paraburkholderia aromaticivorans]|uniref:3-isopropylmalate dehydratase small subunit n=1 Tax=Paraburkholderia aromaticivorans TaxID=2026199 RepID=UPI00145610D5|nr:3-isopropylmalate dehydratase small subunit [Paraburkholderia aromaticivorans]